MEYEVTVNTKCDFAVSASVIIEPALVFDSLEAEEQFNDNVIANIAASGGRSQKPVEFELWRRESDNSVVYGLVIALAFRHGEGAEVFKESIERAILQSGIE